MAKNMKRMRGYSLTQNKEVNGHNRMMFKTNYCFNAVLSLLYIYIYVSHNKETDTREKIYKTKNRTPEGEEIKDHLFDVQQIYRSSSK